MVSAVSAFPMIELVPGEEPNERRIAALLSLPRREASLLSKRCAKMLGLHALEGAAMSIRSDSGLLKDLENCQVTNSGVLEWAADQGGLILAGFHTGAYSTGLAWMLYRHFRHRTIAIVHSRPLTAHEHRAYARFADFGMIVNLIHTAHNHSYKHIVNALRAGNVVLLFVDLPARYGRSITAEILWRRARLSSSFAELSMRCKVPVLRFDVETTIEGDFIHVGEPFEVSECGAISRQLGVDLMAAELTRILLARPHQWLMWGRLDDYLVDV